MATPTATALADATGPTITVTFKLASGKRIDIALSQNITVSEAKTQVEQHCDVPAAQQRFIYRGRILKDPETLASYNIATGHTIHLVRGRGDPPSSTTNIAEPGAASMAGTTAETAQTTPQTGDVPGAGISPDGIPTGLFGALGGFDGGAGGAMGPGFEAFAANGASAGGLPGFPGGMNPQLFQNLMSNTMVQNMMQEIMGNPELLRNVVNANPFLNRMAGSHPVFQSVLSNPELLRTALNPEVLQSVMGLQQSLHRQQQPSAPTPAHPSGGETQQREAGEGAAQTSGSAAAQADFTAQPDATASSGGVDLHSMMQRMMNDPEVMRQMESVMSGLSAPPTGPQVGTGGAAGGAGSNPFGDLLAQLGGARGASMFGGTGPFGQQANAGAAAQPPAERYRTQLQQLEDMGFIDKDTNLVALQRTGGDVNAAISWLLDSGHGN